MANWLIANTKQILFSDVPIGSTFSHRQGDSGPIKQSINMFVKECDALPSCAKCKGSGAVKTLEPVNRKGGRGYGYFNKEVWITCVACDGGNSDKLGPPNASHPTAKKFKVWFEAHAIVRVLKTEQDLEDEKTAAAIKQLT